MGARTTNCIDCGAAVSLIDGVAVVRNGAIALVCRARPETETETATATETATETESATETETETETATGAETETESATETETETETETGRRIAAIVVALAALLVAGAYHHTSSPPRAKTLRVSTASPDLPPLGHIAAAAPEPPRVHALTYSLTAEQTELPWVHPIAGEIRELPDKDDRRFGAERPGNRPSECGSGHCGVDLGEDRGTVVHAALGGTVIRVKRDGGSRSGRYVAIEHPHGLRSSYMHLDSVHPDLVVGIEIASGEAIGTLGKSGIRHSPPHLHFTVERKSDSGWQYVDPEPMLTQATVLETPAPLPPPPDRLSLDLSSSSGRSAEAPTGLSRAATTDDRNRWLGRGRRRGGPPARPRNDASDFEGWRGGARQAGRRSGKGAPEESEE
jgi:murein DD-endopeptidase MepM/ murein hydrolase activator NlpD